MSLGLAATAETVAATIHLLGVDGRAPPVDHPNDDRTTAVAALGMTLHSATSNLEGAADLEES